MATFKLYDQAEWPEKVAGEYTSLTAAKREVEKLATGKTDIVYFTKADSATTYAKGRSGIYVNYRIDKVE